MDNQKKHNLLINPMWNEALISSMTSMVKSYQAMLDNISFVPMMESLVDANNQFAKSIVSAFDMSAFSFNAASIMNLNVRPMLDAYKMSPAITNMAQQLTESLTMSIPRISEDYIEVFSKYEKLFSKIDSFSETEIETMLDGTDYTREEIFEDIEQFKQELVETSNAANVSGEILPEERVNELLKKYPALAHILYVINIIILVMSGVQITEDMVIPGMQKAIVSMQGNEDIFFIKVESAKLYTEPSSHSAVIINIFYGEQVDLVESQNLWDKVTYINQEGEEITGWIAKRNLMTYQDYQFNSDDLYDMK